MERESQSAHTRLINTLAPRLSQANFYRFCQLLEDVSPDRPGLGTTLSPEDDPVRFRPHPGMGFPASEIKGVEWDAVNPALPPTVRTTFLGLYGVDSPLPTGYLDDIAQRREGHEAVEQFLDIFNHRVMTQFYRIWRKYSYPASFAAGGTDNTSQCLLGLIGLGVPGAARQISTPVSRFLALLSTMRLPTRTAEGVTALVKLLAPATRAEVRAHYPQRVAVAAPARLGKGNPVSLSQRQVLGRSASDANSQLLLIFYTDSHDEAMSWMENGQLHSDLLVLLRVYLGWRCTARLQLRLPRHLLPAARLGRQVQLGRNGILGPGAGNAHSACPEDISVTLGIYRGLKPNPSKREAIDGGYHF